MLLGSSNLKNTFSRYYLRLVFPCFFVVTSCSPCLACGGIMNHPRKTTNKEITPTHNGQQPHKETKSTHNRQHLKKETQSTPTARYRKKEINTTASNIIFCIITWFISICKISKNVYKYQLSIERTATKKFFEWPLFLYSKQMSLLGVPACPLWCLSQSLERNYIKYF
jgi:hypothetical protein